MSRSTSRKSLSAESLVSVLVPHISQQTLLLPSLHTQLGLPPSALEADLSALREALLKTVEECVNTRKKEISDWSDRCDAVEARCRRLENAMGRRAASLAELKKVEVFPKRHEQLSAQEDKLHQLYSSKLDQLNVLTNRLIHLSSTLGPSFFSDDTLHPTPAPGEIEHFADKETVHENEDDERLLRDVTPERFNRLEKELVRGKKEVSRRLASLSALFEEIAWLFTELGVLLPSPTEPVPSATELPFPKPYQSKVVNKGDPFIVVPMPDPVRQRNEYFPLFAAFVSKLQEAVDEGRDSGGIDGIDPTPILVEWFEHLKADLEEEKAKREIHIQTQYDQLEVLWKRMGISDADIDDFVELNRGLAAENIRAYELELERMLEMKREKMSTFIGNSRAEIERLWDDLMWSDEERDVFTAFHDDEHTEDLLTIHEEEIVRLKEERRSKAPILVAIRKYYQICDEQKQLEASASDQSRLLGRGTRGDPGRLLREEKMRKRVQRDKPKLEQDLLVLVPEWEAENGKPLLVNGVHFLGQLEEAVRAEEAKAESKKRPRTNSTVGRATTPALPTHSRKFSAALSTTPSLRSASGSSHASTVFSTSTMSTTSSVLGPAHKRQKLNNAFPHPVQPHRSVSTTSSSALVSGSARTAKGGIIPQRPASRAGATRAPTTPSMPLVSPVEAGSGKPFLPPRAPSRAGAYNTRATSPSKLSSVTTVPMSVAKSAPVLNPPPNQIKPAVFPAVNSKVTAVIVASKGAVKEDEENKLSRGKRRESFKPRPSSPGLGREYAEMWRGKTMLGEDPLTEDSDGEL